MESSEMKRGREGAKEDSAVVGEREGGPAHASKNKIHMTSRIHPKGPEFPHMW
jgi:hypothetical protein